MIYTHVLNRGGLAVQSPADHALTTGATPTLGVAVQIGALILVAEPCSIWRFVVCG